MTTGLGYPPRCSPYRPHRRTGFHFGAMCARTATAGIPLAETEWRINHIVCGVRFGRAGGRAGGRVGGFPVRVRFCECALMRECVLSWMRACVRACVRAYVRGCVRAWMRACVRGCVRACVRAWMRACVCVDACVRGCATAHRSGGDQMCRSDRRSPLRRVVKAATTCVMACGCHSMQRSTVYRRQAMCSMQQTTL